MYSKNSAGQNWGLHIAVIATKEDRGQEESATQEENTALAQFRSEENRWSGPGSTAVCTQPSTAPVNRDLGNLL